jgi:hypothetical protein
MVWMDMQVSQQLIPAYNPLKWKGIGYNVQGVAGGVIAVIVKQSFAIESF